MPDLGRHKLLSLGLRTAAIGIVVFFLGRSVLANWDEIGAYHWQLRALPLVSSVLVEVGAILFWATIWWHMVGRSGHLLTWSTGVRIYVLSNLAKYIPGSIWGYVGRGVLGRESGLTGGVVGISAIWEIGITVVASLLLVACTLPFYSRPVPAAILVAVIAAAVMSFLVLLPPVVSLWSKWVVRRFRLQLRVCFTWRDFVLYLLSALATHILVGTAFFLFVRSLVDLSWTAWWAVVGIWSFAATAGLVIIFVPYGLGVREGMLALLLAPYLPQETALVISIAARLWTMFAEFVCVLCVIALQKRTSASIPVADENSGDMGEVGQG